MACPTFHRTIVRWRARVWRILPVLALALALMGPPPGTPPASDSPSQGDIHRAHPEVNWNS